MERYTTELITRTENQNRFNRDVIKSLKKENVQRKNIHERVKRMEREFAERDRLEEEGQMAD